MKKVCIESQKSLNAGEEGAMCSCVYSLKEIGVELKIKAMNPWDAEETKNQFIKNYKIGENK